MGGEPTTEMPALRVLSLQRVDTTRQNRRLGGAVYPTPVYFFFSVGKKYSDSKQSLNTFCFELIQYRASQVVPVVKNPFAKQEMCVRSLGWEDSHSIILARRTPRKEAPCGLTVQGVTVRHD